MPNPNQPLVSVVIRSMDRPSLQRALASVAAQGYLHIEVITAGACGASHRDLLQTCGPFPLKLRRSDHPLPRAEAANAGLDAARGDWINLLDDDDVFLPEHVSSLMDILSENPDARLAYARSLSIEKKAGNRNSARLSSSGDSSIPGSFIRKPRCSQAEKVKE